MVQATVTGGVRQAGLILLVLALAGCKCFENCRFGRGGRDVGRVQNNVGPGYAEVYPRTGVQPYSQAVLNGPVVPPTNVAQGNRLEVAGGPPIGAQVPVAPNRDGLPPGAIDPLSPNARPFPNPAAAPPPVMAANPVPAVPMAPMVPVAPQVPVMVGPAPVAAIPVVFNSPVTRSTTVPIGTAVAVTAPPAGSGVMIQPGMVPAGPGMNPGVAPQGAGSLAPNYAQGGFLSGVNTGGLRLRPRMAGEAAPPAVDPRRSAIPRPADDRPPIRTPSPPQRTPGAPPIPPAEDRPPINRPDTGKTSPLPPVPPMTLPEGPSDPLPPGPPKIVPKSEDKPEKLEEPGSLDDLLKTLPAPSDDPSGSP